MRTSSKIALGLLMLATNAAYSASVDQSSSVTYWSSTGDHADLVVYYDYRAKVPLNVTKLFINSVATPITGSLIDCQKCTPIKSGDTVVGETLQPGGFMVWRGFRTLSGVAGQVTLTDGTANLSNINAHVRTSLEIRSAVDDVLAHVEVH